MTPANKLTIEAEDIMTRELITVAPEMTSHEAAKVMLSNKISGAAVVDKQNNLLGVVSMSDLLAQQDVQQYAIDYFSQGLITDVIWEKFGFNVEPNEILVSDCMSRNVETVEPHTPLEEIASILYDSRIHRVIVVKRGTMIPVGIITSFDLVKLLADGAIKYSV